MAKSVALLVSLLSLGAAAARRPQANEGTLHQWPAYDADSDPGDLTARDKDLFATVMSKPTSTG